MSKERNNLFRLFHKAKIFFINILVMHCLFLANAVAMISSQLCDKELDQYCPTGKYNSAKLRLKCIETKKKFFTYECVVRILGLPVSEELKFKKAPWLMSQKQEQDHELTKTEADLLIKKYDVDNGKNEFDINLDNSKSITDSLGDDENLTLKDTMLKTNCLSDMSRLCKVKTKKGVTILKESLESCMSKMIKRESRLTLSCHISLLNILNKSNTQYTRYNVNGVTIHRGDRLRHISNKKTRKNRINSVRK